jgi:uncharacterized coiled-coil protein SlyX
MTSTEQVKNRDDQLAKAKRMMVALNNKFKAKFAKMEETNAARAAAQAASEGGGGASELDADKEKLAACQGTIDELQKALADQQAACEELREKLADMEASHQGMAEKDSEIAELKAAVEEVCWC